ncbi:PAS domain-containing sensor histidine kinase [Thalassotalea sp. G2M2-11]|uniref:hybrid sensor histidine kinase/response regulator n=1 Tax=Thalassotalea sp. G2M2-11 TaxID=2787627 RepID=UPI0019D24D62|nr:PAS domain-containing sensor histidine kinase [Thalassotalea sp. G2M2-11]
MVELAQALPQIIKNLHASYQDNFFNSILLEINKLANSDYLFIAKVDLDNETATTIALLANGSFADNFQYKLEHTPCAKVTGNDVCVYTSDICKLYPNDQLLIDMKIEGYIGVPLYNSASQLIGIIVALHTKKITQAETITTLFELFSGHIGAEIEKQDQQKTLEQLNKTLEQKVNELTESKNKLAMHLQNTPLGCITWDSSLQCVEWNKAAENIFGYHADEIIGQPITELILSNSEHDKADDFYASLFSQHYSSQSSHVCHDKWGRMIKCNWYNTPIINENGKITGIASLIHDVTDQELQQELLRRSQKMEALGTLTGGIAHDQNNLLAIILGYTELLTIAVKDQPKLLNYVKKIQDAGIRGTQLISKLLAFTRTESISAAKVNINQLIEDERDVLQKTLTVQINLTCNLAEDLWLTNLDANDFNDAILNLSINALHAIQKKQTTGKITITTTNLSIDEKEAETLDIKAGDYVQLRFNDNGIGMSKQVASKVFDPFFSTKGKDGSGLGLSQVFSFVKRSKGGITIETAPDQGCTITIYFPRTDIEELNQVRTKSKQREKLGGNETILVVDDEQQIRNLCVELLSIKGYTTLSADGYQQALSILDSEQIDLMISDVIMPEVNGYELAKIVQEKHPEVKILLASGYTDEDLVDEQVKHLQEQLLTKPYSAKSLYKSVQKALNY